MKSYKLMKAERNPQENRIMILLMAKLRFNRLSATNKAGLAHHVVEKMTGNPHYLTPRPSLAEITAAANALRWAEASLDGSKYKTSLRNTAEAKLDKLMRSLQSYVCSIAGDNKEMILSSGMDVRKTRTPKSTPDAVTAITLKLGQLEGSIDITWKGSGRGCMYEVFATPDSQDESSWKSMGFTSKQRMTVKGLPGGVLYNFRVRCYNTAGPSGFSETYSLKTY